MPERVSCFVIMPYSEGSDRLYAEIIAPVLAQLPGDGVLALRADRIGPRALTLKAHVEDAVRSADFCIADLTGNNPNVMYELGYASASQKPVILIRERARGELPANVREAIVLDYSPAEADSFRESLAEQCRRVLQSIAARPSARQGVAGAPAEFLEGNEPLNRLLESVSSRLLALVFSPAPFLTQVMPKLRERTSPGLSVRLLCSNPESEFSQARAKDINVDVARLRSGMWRDLQQVQRQAREFRGARIEVRVTDGYAANAIYLSDEMVLLAPYISASGARGAPQLLFGRSAEIYSLLEREFERSWSRSRALTADGARL